MAMVTKVIGVKIFNAKNADVNEREALYNLKVEVLDTVDSLFYPDQRIRSQQCGASTMNMVSSTSRQYDYDGKAPHMIEFKNIVNKFGINNATGSDEI